MLFRIGFVLWAAVYQLGSAQMGGMMGNAMGGGVGNLGNLGLNTPQQLGGSLVYHEEKTEIIPGATTGVGAVPVMTGMQAVPVATGNLQIQQPIVQPAISQPPIMQRIIQPVIQRYEQQRILQPILQPVEMPTIVKTAVVQPNIAVSGPSDAVLLQGQIHAEQYQRQIVEPAISKAPVLQPIVQPIIQPIQREKILQPIVETAQLPTIVKAPIIEPTAHRPAVAVQQVAVPVQQPQSHVAAIPALAVPARNAQIGGIGHGSVNAIPASNTIPPGSPAAAGGMPTGAMGGGLAAQQAAMYHRRRYRKDEEAALSEVEHAESEALSDSVELADD